MGNEPIRITRDFNECTERPSKGWGAGNSAKRDIMKNMKLEVGLEVKRELFGHQKNMLEYGLKSR